MPNRYFRKPPLKPHPQPQRMSFKIRINAERTLCTGTHDQLLRRFSEKQITMIQVRNLPDTSDNTSWIMNCARYPGMIEVQSFRMFAWHRFATPESACRFMIDTHGTTFEGNSLIAEGLHHDGMRFHEILSKTREDLATQGVQML